MTSGFKFFEFRKTIKKNYRSPCRYGHFDAPSLQGRSLVYRLGNESINKIFLSLFFQVGATTICGFCFNCSLSPLVRKYLVRHSCRTYYTSTDTNARGKTEPIYDFYTRHNPNKATSSNFPNEKEILGQNFDGEGGGMRGNASSM